MSKADLLIRLFDEASNCHKCDSFNSPKSKPALQDGLVNIFQDKNFALNIPSIWTDWINRANSKLMIVGQDWGPFTDMERLNKKYTEIALETQDEKKAWMGIVNEPESMTKKLMTQFIIQSGRDMDVPVDETIMNSFYVTNAVLCARKGTNYRGNNNFKPRFCTENCANILKREIEIIEPNVIITLGYWPFYSVAKSYGIPVYKTLKENLLHYSISLDNIVNISDNNRPMYILPVYHPTAQVKKAEQISLYRLMWQLLLIQYTKSELIYATQTYFDHREAIGV